ncbi:16S rRNA (cytosine(1402)-N(4))-methyltransferase [Candidatus Nomurabacteria bacterium RIFCSPLOWO2_02_FULL_40_10]|uniref:Ribosomal RNA small subunit methyltransferase H n=1 Tax=Candidatus Nomurabacteria bacterium RIFCSPLOWO2_02_FULL_40_10 TaxID=1801786 RepID=A0A1F6Y0W0_9BACT|nr:MAG: 16S rRNA (cytosine(1402)-N(4))-methyltransferase [Candidatus Nomurabacteria bacterium RIFCSPLOWO2_02_FULL_40_10]
MKHVPVLLNKVLEILDASPRKFIIDGTVDGGGHAVEIIKRLSPNGVFLGIDWDKSMLAEAKSRVTSPNSGVRVFLIEDNYANLPAILKDKKLGKADGLLLDLGFSSDQLESSGRGFSFLKDEPLIMRYASKGISAAEVINGRGEADLADIFWKYGEERMSRRIAKKIVEARKRKKILTTFDLIEAVKSAVPGNYEKGRIHPATRVFQALRIYVNGELDNLEGILKNLSSILKPQGIITIISFHSLEDRLVKNYFKGMEKNGLLTILTKKPIVPEKEEIIANPKSRSAKLRAASIKIPIF